MTAKQSSVICFTQILYVEDWSESCFVLAVSNSHSRKFIVAVRNPWWKKFFKSS